MGRGVTLLINTLEDCCGCGACAQKCPLKCIEMKEDKEGFLYPFVNDIQCIHCDLCKSVCPFYNSSDTHEPLESYSVINQNKRIREESSSGGAFSLIAEQTLRQGGVVFGAMFDNQWNVFHGCVDNIEDLRKLRGSKYVQSTIGKSYDDAKFYLNKGKQVLFSGTPCQIAGLKRFLGKDEELLTTVDFICHGVPSPKFWKWYLYRISPRNAFISNINFRNKDNGWRDYNMSIDIKYYDSIVRLSCFHRNNPFMEAFLNNKSLRPSCSSCRVKSGKSHSDITLADFWNIEKVTGKEDDNKGVSLVLANTIKGKGLISTLRGGEVQSTNFNQAIQYNTAWKESFQNSPERDSFFSSYANRHSGYGSFVGKGTKRRISFIKRLKHCLKKILNHEQ